MSTTTIVMSKAALAAAAVHSMCVYVCNSKRTAKWWWWWLTRFLLNKYAWYSWWAEFAIPYTHTHTDGHTHNQQPSSALTCMYIVQPIDRTDCICRECESQCGKVIVAWCCCCCRWLEHFCELDNSWICASILRSTVHTHESNKDSETPSSSSSIYTSISPWTHFP